MQVLSKFSVARFEALALLGSAQIALRLLSPLDAHAAVIRVGAWMPCINDPSRAREFSRLLGKRGSCLGRALAVAARTPAAEVAIAVAPPAAGGLFAHAWVEMNGLPLEPGEVAGAVIARLRRTGNRAR